MDNWSQTSIRAPSALAMAAGAESARQGPQRWNTGTQMLFLFSPVSIPLEANLLACVKLLFCVTERPA